MTTPPIHRRAFGCATPEGCPATAGEAGCPAWTEIVEENARTGAVRARGACGLAIQAEMTTQAIAAVVRVQDEVAERRNEAARQTEDTLERLHLLEQAVGECVDRLNRLVRAATPPAASQPPLIESSTRRRAGSR